MIDLHYDSDSTLLAKQAALAIQNAIIYASSPCLFLSSGGSSFTILDYLDPSAWYDTTIGVLDERYSLDRNENNFLQLAATDFFKNARKHDLPYIDTSVHDNESQEQLAERFDQALKQWMQDNPHGCIIATIGIGDDGHIAGMMPFPEEPSLFDTLFVNTNDYAIGYDAKEKNPFPLRVTTTVPFLETLSQSIVYVVGEKKKEALARLIQSDGSIYQTPARILHELKHVTLYTDQEVSIA